MSNLTTKILKLPLKSIVNFILLKFGMVKLLKLWPTISKMKTKL